MQLDSILKAIKTYGATASVPAVILTSALADNAEITIDVDGISGGATEAGLKITLIGTRV